MKNNYVLTSGWNLPFLQLPTYLPNKPVPYSISSGYECEGRCKQTERLEDNFLQVVIFACNFFKHQKNISIVLLRNPRKFNVYGDEIPEASGVNAPARRIRRRRRRRREALGRDAIAAYNERLAARLVYFPRDFCLSPCFRAGFYLRRDSEGVAA